jgi:hypothetical protein
MGTKQGHGAGGLEGAGANFFVVEPNGRSDPNARTEACKVTVMLLEVT